MIVSCPTFSQVSWPSSILHSPFPFPLRCLKEHVHTDTYTDLDFLSHRFVQRTGTKSTQTRTLIFIFCFIVSCSELTQSAHKNTHTDFDFLSHRFVQEHKVHTNTYTDFDFLSHRFMQRTGTKSTQARTLIWIFCFIVSCRELAQSPHKHVH